jgi:uncharacterized membrane protein
MNKGITKIAAVSLKNLKVAYLVTGIIIASMLIQTLIYFIIGVSSGGAIDSSGLSIGNILWMIPIWAAIAIPLGHFRRIVNLGGKRDNFIRGCFLVYTTMALVGALANTLIYYTYDRLIQTSGVFSEEAFGGVMNVVEIFGWTNNGMIVAFLQQFAFLFLLMSVIHTLVAMQDKPYGWITDGVIAAIISTFVPIASLRPALLGFFWLIIFQPNAFFQIAACLVLGIAVFTLNKPIFARKAV